MKLVPIRKAALSIINVLAPPICAVCSDVLRPEDQTLCKHCRSSFKTLMRPLCPTCGAPMKKPGPGKCPRCPKTTHFQHARAAFRYDGALADAIQSLKYSQHFELGRTLAHAMFMALVKLEEDALPFDSDLRDHDDPTGLGKRLDVVVPVPMHFTRRWKRGYNHAEILCTEFAKLANIPCDPNLLVRSRRTPQQARLSHHPTTKARPNASERQKNQKATQSLREANVRGAFESPHPNQVQNLRIGLFDDVLTSGSTINECARTLREAGAKEVWALALARA